MRFRFTFIVMGLCAVASSAAAADLFPLPNAEIATAARQLRAHNYKDAGESAAKAPQGGLRSFILGLSAARQEKWADASSQLAAAADSFPLLADYALYDEARALSRLARFSEATAPLQRLFKEFPTSPLVRPAQLLYADTLYDAKDFAAAYTAYQKFVEQYPSGPDALSAAHKSALCLEQQGNTAGAVTALRAIWLKNPASLVASQAEEDLKRLAATGATVAPYTPAELLQRATALYELKRYEEAANALQSVPTAAQPTGTADRFLVKAGQALFRNKRYKDAEAALSALLERKPPREIVDEARYWLAKTFDRTGRGDDACTVLTGLATAASSPELADRALFEAAFIRKGQKKTTEAVALLKRILLSHPTSPIRQSVTWQIAWESYQAGDMKTAAEYLKPLTEQAAYREKALYWYSHALSATGDATGAQRAIASLLAEFPFGFYAQSYRSNVNLSADDITFPAASVADILPLPAGFDRVKALITLGLTDEARKELALVAKKKLGKGTSLQGIARLYLEMDDYNGAFKLLRNERPQRFARDTAYKWGISYPLAYRDQVAQLAAAHNVPESLVYAIIRAESSFLPTALSSAGAVGLMQLMPSTAAAVASPRKGRPDTGALTTPATNIRFGIRHLRDLLTLYNGDVVLAVAAYNAGSGNVNRWRKAFGGLRRDEFVENIPFLETREYVKKVLASADIYSRLYKLGTQSIAAPAPPAPQPSAGGFAESTATAPAQGPAAPQQNPPVVAN